MAAISSDHGSLYGELISTLDFLTGDYWSIEFKKRKHQTAVRPQAKLPFSSKPPLVMPYSDGLDSFATARLIAKNNPATPLILVTTGKRKLHGADPSDVERSLYRVSIPFQLAENRTTRLREPSYRSRAFVFGVMAGVAAHLLGAERIISAESGQGSLGPWLMPVGNEAPDMRLHPSFTHRLDHLLHLILDSRFQHDHPHLWKTKGETLKELDQSGQSKHWWHTSSCARDARHVLLNGESVQCGVCAGCLLRRQSLFSSGLDERQDRYLWSDLQASTLNRASTSRKRPTRLNDERQAQCAVLELDSFGKLTDEMALVNIASAELSSLLNEPSLETENKLCRLITKHRNEWGEFVSSLGPKAFIAKWRDALK
jgi:7-cyano-7-deazaguanine synthase in queuosine biosynthesis